MKTTLFFLSVLALLLPSCNTVAGVGSDIMAGGKALETAAQKSGQAIDNTLNKSSSSASSAAAASKSKTSAAER